MQRLVTPDSAFAWIKMQRQVDHHLFLLVEGDDEDSILYGHFLRDDVSILVLGGKPNVLATSRLLALQPVKGVYSLIDRDMDDLTGSTATYPPNLVATKGYDLVSDIVAVRPDLFERTLRVHGKDVFDAVEVSTGSKFTDLCNELCLKLSALRLVNDEEQLGLNLRDYPFAALINSDFSSKEYSDFIREANSRSKVTVDVSSVEVLVRAAASRIGGDTRFCGGHDLVGAASALLRRGGAKSVGADNLAASLFTATDCETIGRLPVKDSICDWAGKFSRAAFDCSWRALN